MTPKDDPLALDGRERLETNSVCAFWGSWRDVKIITILQLAAIAMLVVGADVEVIGARGEKRGAVERVRVRDGIRPIDFEDGKSTGEIDVPMVENTFEETNLEELLPFTCPPGKLPEAKEKGKCKLMRDVSRYFPSSEYYFGGENGKRVAYPDLTPLFDVYERRKCDSPGNVRVHANPGTGFGAIVMYSIYQFADAIETKKKANVYDFSAGSLPGFAGKACGNRSLRCYLKPLSKCDIQTINRAQMPKLDPKHRSKQRVPAEARSFFSWHAALSNRLWRPNDEFASKVAKLKEVMKWPNEHDFQHRVISIHVRKGDACATKNRVKKYGCASFKEYATYVDLIRNAYPNTFSHIFLATDDEKTVKEAERHCAQSDLELMYAPIDRKWYHPKTWSKNRGKFAKKLNHRQKKEEHFQVGFIERRLRAGDGDPERIGMETAADVELLASGHAFIGTFSSNMGRLAFEIMTDRLKRIPPYVSVDGTGWKYGQSEFVEKESSPPNG